ncbi:MAG: hypothetical protein NC489_26500, partial [Ruminococcus flavefaciens]|nr:hypothetical protein [Ruminococcus flavefaciens]
GDWGILLENLDRISKMRQNNEIHYVEIKMVVQRSNYSEMIDFIRMGKKYHVDRVVFTKLLNWDMYSEEDYLEKAMLNHDGSLQTKLKEILQRDEFQDKIVQTSEFRYYLETVE